MKFRYLNSVICFCLTWALSVLPAQAQDTHRTAGHGLASNIRGQKLSRDSRVPFSFSQSQKKDAQSLSRYILGVYYENLGDLEEAAGEYQKALINDPQSSLLHLNLASILIQKDNLVQAVKELKKSIELDAEAVQPHALLALVYAAGGNSDLAVGEYTLALENATKFEPENINIYKGLGEIYLQQKKLKQAESIFRLVIGIAPDDAQAHFFLGDIYYELKNYSSAEKELKSAVKLKPDYHEALNFLGYFYLEQNRNIEQAGALIRQALGFDPENGAYIDSLGWFYYKKGKFKEALNYLEKAASLINDPEVYDHLGDVSLKLGNSESAKINWEKSLKLDAQQDKVKMKLFKLTRDGK